MEQVRADAAVVTDEEKKTPDSCVPNSVITCTADDDLDAAADALQMIDAFRFPTAEEVSFSQSIHSVCQCWLAAICSVNIANHLCRWSSTTQ